MPDKPDIAGVTRPFTDEEVRRIPMGILLSDETPDEYRVEELERLAEL
jgi:hypothetical protein